MLAATYGQVSDIPVLFNIKLKLFPGSHLHPEAGVHACWMVGHLHPIVHQLLILHKAVHLTDCPCLQLPYLQLFLTRILILVHASFIASPDVGGMTCGTINVHVSTGN